MIPRRNLQRGITQPTLLTCQFASFPGLGKKFSLKNINLFRTFTVSYAFVAPYSSVGDCRYRFTFSFPENGSNWVSSAKPQNGSVCHRHNRNRAEISRARSLTHSLPPRPRPTDEIKSEGRQGVPRPIRSGVSFLRPTHGPTRTERTS